MSSAKLDILFFIGMFYIVLISFAISGHLLFGKVLTIFNDIGKSILTCITILSSEFPYDAVTSVEPVYGPIYYILYSCMMILIMLQVFIAILDGHYTQLKNDYKDRVSLKKNIYFCLFS